MVNTMDNEEKNVNEFDNQENINNLENQDSNQELNNVETTEINADYENKEHEEAKKNNTLVILLIVFIVISLVLGGYIFYDKVIKKEEVKEPPVDDNNKQEEPKNDDSNKVETDEQVEPKDTSNKGNELVNFNINQFLERKNVTEDGKNYYKVLTYNNNKLTVDFKFYTEKENSEIFDIIEHIKADIYINNIKKTTKELEQFYHCDDCNKAYSNVEEAKEYSVRIVKGSVGTIKGDKYYVYLHLELDDQSLYIINEKGEILDSPKIKFYDFSYGMNQNKVLVLSAGCQTYQFANVLDNGERIGSHFFKEDAIYYLKLSKYSDEKSGFKEYANEYKITASNDKVNVEKLDTCSVSASGEKPYDSEYEDM